tara:strand:+ start:498 stop:959 length:462 start_codon:yes stop_codon:yes gene_type:complete
MKTEKVNHKVHNFDLLVTEPKENWDKCRAIGEETEFMIKDVLNTPTRIEVKTEDAIWQKTKNFFLETRNTKQDKTSGLHATNADWWSHAFRDKDTGEILRIVWYPVWLLKSLLERWIEEGIAQKRNLHNAEGYIIPINIMLRDLENAQRPLGS